MCATPSDAELQAKQVKQWWRCAAAGLSGMLPEAVAQVRQQAATGPCPGFIGVQRKGPEWRSIATDLIFCYFFIKEKVMGLNGQERSQSDK